MEQGAATDLKVGNVMGSGLTSNNQSQLSHQ